jgi:hypothetical protein
VGVTGGEGVRLTGSKELKLDGVAVGGMSDLPRPLVKRIHPIPRIETTPIAIGIRRARSNEGRGCIPGKVLPRLYPHSFHKGFQKHAGFERLIIWQPTLVFAPSCVDIILVWIEKKPGKEITTRTWKTVGRILKAMG